MGGRRPALLLALLIGVAVTAASLVPAAAGPSVRLTVTADRTSYATGAPMTFTVALVNGTPRPATLRFPTAQRYDVVVQDREGRDVWRWSADQMFAQAVGEETLAPGRARRWRVTVRERFAPGRYTVAAIVPATDGALRARVTIDVR